MTPEQEHQLTLLMAASQRGDAAAYDTLLQSLSHVAELYVRRRVGDEPWIEDVVQDVLVSLHRSRHTWNPARPFAPWFYAVLNSRFIDAIRRHKRLERWEAPIGSAPPAVWAPAAESGVMARNDLAQAMKHLTPAQQLVIERLRLNESSVKDVARETGMSESNVKVVAHRGYVALRQVLSRLGYGDK